MDTNICYRQLIGKVIDVPRGINHKLPWMRQETTQYSFFVSIEFTRTLSAMQPLHKDLSIERLCPKEQHNGDKKPKEGNRRHYNKRQSEAVRAITRVPLSRSSLVIEIADQSNREDIGTDGTSHGYGVEDGSHMSNPE